jgi:hypothetical protein
MNLYKKTTQTFVAAIAAIVAIGFSAQASHAANAGVLDPDGAYKLGSVEIKKIDQYDIPIKAEDFLGSLNNCDSADQGVKPSNFDGITPDIDINMVINLAQKAWAFIEANKAVANVKTQTANALPSGLKCWNQLTNWHAPRSEVYQVSYKNLFGIEVVNLQFAVVYSWGGKYRGLGSYLTNATVQYRNLDVTWGWTVNADVAVPMVTNMGTEASPVAGLQLDLHWKVEALSHSESTASFFVSGDGRPTQQL